MFIIYTKAKLPKKVFVVNLTKQEVDGCLNGDLFVDNKDLNPENYIVVENYDLFQYPISDDLESVREATREEQILFYDKKELLLEGEIVQNNKVIVVEPSEEFVQKKWDFEKKVWLEGAKKEEIILKRKDLILEYANIKNQISQLEELRDEFESDEAVSLLKIKLGEIKKKIDNYVKIIKKLK